MHRAAAVTVLLATSLAYADPPGMTPEVAPAPQPAQPGDRGVPGYRGWTLGADAAAVGLLLVAADREDEGLAKLSLATYLLGAPLVHVMKDRPTRGLTSLGLRVGLPIVGAMLGEALHSEPQCESGYDYVDCSDGPSDEAVLGVVVGIIAASAIDSVYLAKGEAPKPQPQWSPSVRGTQGGFALGVNGRF